MLTALILWVKCANVFEVLRVLSKMEVMHEGNFVCRLPPYDRLDFVRVLIESILGTQCHHMLTVSRSLMIVGERWRFKFLFHRA